MTTPLQARKPYGLWDSPISPASMARGVSFSDVAWDQNGSLVWREGRADRAVLVVQPPDGQAPRDLNSDYAVRARVGYGGGDFCVSQGCVVFAEAASARLFSQGLAHGVARSLTPGFGAAAAPQFSPDGRWILFVHSYEGEDSLAVVDREGESWPTRIAWGHDFYMQPAWHPDSQQFAVIAWDHPHMPWDGASLILGRLDVPPPGASSAGLPRLASQSIIAGGEQVSVFQPEFSPDGRLLAYVSDETGWWQIYVYDLQTQARRQLTSELAEHAVPAWGQGMRTFAFSPDGQRLVFIRSQEGRQTLWQVELASGEARQLVLDGYTSLEQVAVAPDGERLALIASGAAIPPRLIVRRSDGVVQVVRRSAAENLTPDTYSLPEHITWTGHDGGAVYGVFYPPHSRTFTASGQPPLIVSVHGGPTGQRLLAFAPSAQFFASRGYAFMEVNYRGSTGYGRAYREKLRGSWGIYDVEDAVSGARWLADQGLVDEKRMVILGGSAGGYTVLQTLVDHPGFFKAGVCLYGISNQFTLAAETHKFESHYTDSLLGPLPEAADIYRSRSPLFFLDRLRDPIAIFQGEEDQVVPRAQSDEVAAVCQRRGVPHIYHLYPGEGHGFRKSETVEHYYKAVEQFLRQHVIFA
jgi:dipeptidyl aminopeptidase/acylaminoacyl peptidase